MSKILTMDEMARNVAQKALDEVYYKDKSIREWAKIILSEDAISRQAVLNLTKELRFNSVKGMEDYCYRCIDPYDVEDLPPIQPKVKVGKWINNGTQDSMIGEEYKCSICNEVFILDNNFNYCPNCGAKMEVEE